MVKVAKTRKMKAGTNVTSFKAKTRTEIYKHNWSEKKSSNVDASKDASIILASTVQELGSSTSRVIGKGLDHLMFSALVAIHSSSTLLIRGLSEMITVISLNQRRVFSNSKSKSSKRETIDEIFSFLVNARSNRNSSTSLGLPEAQYMEVVNIDLDKAYYRQIIVVYLDVHSKYSDCQDLILEDSTNKHILLGKMRRIESYSGACPATFYGMGVMVKHYFKLYEEFLDKICAKYYKLALTEAIKVSKLHAENTIDTQDLFKKLVIALIRALDRYSYLKGTFTFYLKFFFQDARVKNVFDYDYAQVYRAASLTSVQSRKEMEVVPTLYSPFDQMSAEEVADDSDFSVPLTQLIKANDSEEIIEKIRHIRGMDMAKIFLGIRPEIKTTT